MARTLTPSNALTLLKVIGGRLSIGVALPAPVAWLTITGSTIQGAILTAVLGGGAPTITGYQWLRGYTPISGATASTYTTTVDDIGSVIRVVASYVGGPGYSAPTAQITGTASLVYEAGVYEPGVYV